MFLRPGDLGPRAGRAGLRVLLAVACAVASAEQAGGAAAKRTCVISDEGARGDGRTLDTRAIQGAIDRCSRAGGGTVVVPLGTFLAGALFLKKGVSLRVEKDGVLKASVDRADYPRIPTRWEGIERDWTSAFINAVDLAEVELSGAGVIDGSGVEWLERYPRPRPPAPGAPTPPEPPGTPGRPRLVCFQGCRGVRVSGLTFRDQASWGLHVLYSEDVTLEDLIIRADHGIPSSDGIDVDSSRKVRIARCDIDVNDDCISIKSGKDADGLRVDRPSEDVLIEGCRFGYGHGGVAMGSETSGGIRDVTVRDCVAESGNWAPIRFKSQPSRGGIVERIVYRDLVLRGVRRAFEFNMEWRMVPPLAPPAAALPVVRGVKLVRVTGSADSAGLLHGLAGSPIRDVAFEGCRLVVRTGLVLENVEAVDLSGLSLDVREGPAVLRRPAPASMR